MQEGEGAKNCVLKPEPLDKIHLPANPNQGDAVSLVSISNVQGVNNLAPDQSLTFAEIVSRSCCSTAAWMPPSSGPG
jgi:hypothetical protein